MPANARRRSQRKARDASSTPAPPDRKAWLAPPVGAIVIVGLAALASLAQSAEPVFVAAALVFSLVEGLVLAIVGYTWSRKSLLAASLAGALTAALASPARWETGLLMRPSQPVPQRVDLLADLLISVAWGAFAGLAGATVLRSKLGALMRDGRPRFSADHHAER